MDSAGGGSVGCGGEDHSCEVTDTLLLLENLQYRVRTAVRVKGEEAPRRGSELERGLLVLRRKEVKKHGHDRAESEAGVSAEVAKELGELLVGVDW